MRTSGRAAPAVRSQLKLCPLIVALLLSPAARPCTFVHGYFYQVTHLRGKVVGVSKGDLRHAWRWTRQHVVRDDAKLTLYQYHWPVKSLDEQGLVKAVRTNQHGAFDFGELNAGHYTLAIDSPVGYDLFDVEITNLPRRTASVTIDVSPVWPDCTGGHELLVGVE